MGQCQYRYNPSEQYQRTKPGMAPETICGALTYPAVDETERIPVARADGVMEMMETGRMIARGYHDPYCPAHGGTVEPPPAPVTLPELENAYTRYHELAQRFTGAIPATVPSPEEVYQAITAHGDHTQQEAAYQQIIDKQKEVTSGEQ